MPCLINPLSFTSKTHRLQDKRIKANRLVSVASLPNQQVLQTYKCDLIIINRMRRILQNRNRLKWGNSEHSCLPRVLILRARLRAHYVVKRTVAWATKQRRWIIHDVSAAFTALISIFCFNISKTRSCSQLEGASLATVSCFTFVCQLQANQRRS